MKLRTRLLGSIAVAGLAGGAIVAVLWRANLDVHHLQSEQQRTENLSSAASQLGNLTLQYLHSPNATIAAQWQATLALAAADARGLQAEGDAEHALQSSAVAAVNQSAALFTRLTGTTPSQSGTRAVFAQQLELQTQQIEASADQLQQRRREDIKHAIDAADRRVLVLVGGLLITEVLLALWVLSGTYRTLGALEHGARTVGAGDLGYRIDLQRADELGDVADAFDDMAARLETANTELAEANVYLERTVAQRTADLTVAVQELERQAKARQQWAQEVNDAIVQTLVAAETTADLGRAEESRQLLHSATAAVRSRVTDLLRESGPIEPGSLVRSRPSEQTGPPAEVVRS